MKVRITKVGSSAGIIVPRVARRIFGYKIGDEFKVDFSAAKIVLTKLKPQQVVLRPKPMPVKVVPTPKIEPAGLLPEVPMEDNPVTHGFCSWCGLETNLEESGVRGYDGKYCKECKRKIEQTSGY
ncbi:MAG: hypothetical protein V1678_01035 [Candidatus Aenigmatarchaeota archaeon]